MNLLDKWIFYSEKKLLKCYSDIKSITRTQVLFIDLKGDFIMKKILAVLAIFGFAITAAFANIELSANLVFAPNYTQQVKYEQGLISLEKELKFECPIGEEIKANFFFYSSKHFDIGLNVAEQILAYSKYVDDDEKFDMALNASFVVGPAFRFNINNNNAIFVSPGLAVNLDYLVQDLTSDSVEVMVGCDLGFNIDAGYRLWLLNKDAFHFGIDAGVQYSVGGGAGTAYRLSKGDKTLNQDFDIDLAQRFKVYLGVVCNFGDRGWDK